MTSGAILFARYAYPPNSLGYCGPADSLGLLQYAVAGVVDPGLVQLARGFEGAWPYLQLISEATGLPDPLDHRVVEAYWVGNDWLRKVGPRHLGDSMDDRFRLRSGRDFVNIADSIESGAVPHHSFHVFGVYPWVGLLTDGRKGPTALHVLDRCRIRWGRVVAVNGDRVTVRSNPLLWDGRALSLGPPILEEVTRSINGVGSMPDLAEDDYVALHWYWVCDRLTRQQLTELRFYTDRQLGITNRSGARGPAVTIGAD